MSSPSGVNASCAGVARSIDVPGHLLAALREPSSGQQVAVRIKPPSSVAPEVVLREGESVGPVQNPSAGGSDHTILDLPKDYFTRLAGKDKLAIVSWTTGVPSQGEKGSRSWIALNLALSIRKNTPDLERHFAYVALDSNAHQVLGQYGFNSVLCEASTCRTTDLKDDIWKFRWYLMRTLTGFGISALVVDGDIVFLGNPLRELWHDSDMEVMTDHFFPERHLWEPWVRVEDHINTGFVLVRPTAAVRALISDFMEANWEYEHGGVMRDAMDQRVFNHFIVQRMSADVPTVFGRYENLTFGRRQQIVPPSGFRQVAIRILNPARIAHGMNFFWRRAHLLQGDGSLPAVAHVNGADPKEYFLRDRQVWFIEDWHERFGDKPRLLLYSHPPGLDLRGDFTHFAAAVEIARLLGRRVVLPATMNCRNSPAYYAWGLNVTLQREWDAGNCTFDYFSWAKHLLDIHGDYVVESSIRHHEFFRHLTSESIYTLSSVVTQPSSTTLPVSATTDLVGSSAAVLEVTESILAVRDALRSGLGRNEWDSLKCIFQQFPHQVSVCRDDRYISRFGKGAQCDPYPGQAACGLDGFTCCMAFWGFSEKLEIFTGARWDLPCNCGLGASCVLTRLHKMEKDERQYDRHCCAHALQPSPQEHCMLVPPFRNHTIYGDSHFYSSYLMGDFLQSRIDSPRAFQRCLEHRAGTLLDTDYARAQLHCNQMLAGLALWHRRYDRLFRWLEYMHWERRRTGNATEPLPVEAGEGDGTPSAWKVRHDLEQLRYLARLRPRPQVAPYAPLAPPELARQLGDAFSALLEALQRRGPGSPESGMQIMHTDFAPLLPYYNRAVFVPHVERLEGGALNQSADWQGFQVAFKRQGVAVLDGALRPEALGALRDYFLEATVWYTVASGGSFLKAQLRDGLHAELLLQIAAELSSRLPSALGPHRLADIFAYKYDSDWPGYVGSGAHAMPAAVVVSLMTTATAANLDPSGNGFEVFHAAAGASGDDHHSSNGTPKKMASLKAAGLTSTTLAYRQNRLVIWRAGGPFRVDWSPQKWRAGYRHRRVDLWMLYGEARRALSAHGRGP